ncbi:glycosyltransferase [Bradyrhizobium sp. 38]|uniref:glycosyltransferase n=1 Tax=unclassified Bradyrhizobium TaxID=2631580 RepID=UPI001FFA7AE6|nr:glycosyltransferase [Bradyrhizobium sp. 38]MCK1776836.1 glycosyltransferase [Bradyrhizobium sp. 132]
MANEQTEASDRGVVRSLLKRARSTLRHRSHQFRLFLDEASADHAIGKLRASVLAARNPASSSPTAWFLCPHYKSPSGGVRKLYQCVDTLNAAGLDAAILHARPGFRCSWFENSTRVVSASELTLGPRDIFVVPEVYGRSICNLPRNVRQVIFNQNAYLTLSSLENGLAHAEPYTNNPDLALVLVVSQDNADVIRRTFPAIPVRRLRLGINPSLYHPPQGSKQRRIVYMPRKRPDDAAAVLAQLRLRGALNGWDIVAIAGRSEAETAELLRTARLFLSFSFREGFGLPPLEALACGCIVVGYHGSGGREYFRPPFATAVEDGDVAAFVSAVEQAIHGIDSDLRSADSLATAASRFAFGRYPPEAEKQDILNIFGSLLQS